MISALVTGPSLVAWNVLEAMSITVPIHLAFFKPPEPNARGSTYVSDDEEPSSLSVLLRADPAIAPEVCRALRPLLTLPDLRCYPVAGSIRQEMSVCLDVPPRDMFKALVSFAIGVIEGDASPGVKAWAEVLRGTLVAAGTSLQRGSALHLI